jgi:hypothetical protein
MHSQDYLVVIQADSISDLGREYLLNKLLKRGMILASYKRDSFLILIRQNRGLSLAILEYGGSGAAGIVPFLPPLISLNTEHFQTWIRLFMAVASAELQGRIFHSG